MVDFFRLINATVFIKNVGGRLWNKLCLLGLAAQPTGFITIQYESYVVTAFL
jgi:hypothetical protein